jgi:hypothetical protein
MISPPGPNASTRCSSIRRQLQAWSPPEGFVTLEQRPRGIDLGDVLGAGEHQPALQLPPFQ